MGSGDHLEVVSVVELLGDVLAEGVPGATRVHAPAGAIIGVRPEQVAHGSFVRDFLESFESSDVIKGLNAGRESTMQAEKLILHNSSQREVVEELSQTFPDIRVTILAAAFIIEAIYLRDLARFVISPEDSDSIFVSDLERDEQGDGLHAVVSWISRGVPLST